MQYLEFCEHETASNKAFFPRKQLSAKRQHSDIAHNAERGFHRGVMLVVVVCSPS